MCSCRNQAEWQNYHLSVNRLNPTESRKRSWFPDGWLKSASPNYGKHWAPEQVRLGSIITTRYWIQCSRTIWIGANCGIGTPKYEKLLDVFMTLPWAFSEVLEWYGKEWMGVRGEIETDLIHNSQLPLFSRKTWTTVLTGSEIQESQISQSTSKTFI